MHLSERVIKTAVLAMSATLGLSACGADSVADDEKQPRDRPGSGAVDASGTFGLDRQSYTVDEDGGAATVVIERRAGTEGIVNVSYETVQFGAAVDNRATAAGPGDGDFGAISGALTFNRGESRKRVSVPINDDNEHQGDRIFAFRLTGTDRGSLGTPREATVTIVDDESGSNEPPAATGAFRLSASSYSVAEDAGSLMVNVHRVNGASGAASVRYSTRQLDPGSGNARDGDLGDGDDYDGTSGVLEFADGQTNAAFRVGITDDAEFTGNLRFQVRLYEASTSLDSPAAADVTIVDDEQPPAEPTGTFRLSASGFTVREGGAVQVIVQRVGGDAGTASVDFATFDQGGAVGGQDYAQSAGTLSFADGQTQRTFSVSTGDDDAYTGNRAFGVRLSNASTALGTPAQGTVTITEDESEPGPTGSFRFTSGSYGVAENAGSIQFTVERVSGSDGEASVDFATAQASSGTGAVAGSDYTSRSGTLSFADGETRQTFSVPVIDDTDYTGDLTFAVRLSNPDTALNDPAEAMVTIADDESEPQPDGDLRLSAASYSVREGDGSLTVAVERVGGSTGEVQVDYATFATQTGNGDAAAGTDFQASSGTLVFAEGETRGSFQVVVIDDADYSGDLTFGLRLSNADTSVVSPAQATVTIVDDEPAPEPAPTLVWDAPTTNADGSCVDDLDGFRLNYGLSAGSYDESRRLGLDELTARPTGESTACGEVVSYALPLDMLDAASWYVTVQSRDASGNLSEHSEEIVVTIE